jgi:hypothetical protein
MVAWQMISFTLYFSNGKYTARLTQQQVISEMSRRAPEAMRRSGPTRSDPAADHLINRLRMSGAMRIAATWKLGSLEVSKVSLAFAFQKPFCGKLSNLL